VGQPDDVYGALAAAYLAAQDTVRANPSDADAVAAYLSAKFALDEHRTAVREAEHRAGVSLGADMIRSEG
jgi:hypothetical protein